jgi:hypothetical protein
MSDKFKIPDEEQRKPRVKIKNLFEKTGADPALIETLRKMYYVNAMHKLAVMNTIVARGGNIHTVHPAAVAKRRAANKVAAKQRKVNRAR